MTAADIAEQAKAAVDSAVETACMGVRDAAERIKGDLASGTLALREAAEPAVLPPEDPRFDLDATAHYGGAEDSRYDTITPPPAAVSAAAEPEPSAFDFEVETDEDGIPKWE